jgi:hypothetical protein
MGKRAPLARQIYSRRLRNRSARIPPDIQEALRERGVEVPKRGSFRDVYSQLGIIADPNALTGTEVGFTDNLGQIRKQKRVPPPPITGDGDVFAAAAESIPHGTGYQKHLTEYEMKCVMQLRAFYGDDLEMMAVDHRRNPMQWTVAQLKKKIAVYDAEAALLATIAHEFEPKPDQ